MNDTGTLKEAFLADPRALVTRLGYTVDEKRHDRKNLWVYDGDETEASLAIQTTGKHAGTWTRFGSDESGDCFTLVQRTRPGTSFPDACELVASVYQAVPNDSGDGGDDAPPQRKPKKKRATRAKKVGEERYELLDARGLLVATHVRLDFEDGTKQMWYERKGEKGLGGMATADLPLYGLPNLKRDPFKVKPTFVVEGEKAADALTELGAIAVGTACGASVQPSQKVLSVLKEREVYLWPDADPAGWKHMDGIADKLRTLGFEPKLISDPAAEAKDDAADWLERGGTEESLAALVESAEPYPEPQESEDDFQGPSEDLLAGTERDEDTGLPVIVTTDVPLRVQSREALEAVVAANDPPRVYVRDGKLTTIEFTEDHKAVLNLATEHRIRGIIARSAETVRVVNRGDERKPLPVAPPIDLVRDLESQISAWVAEHGEWPFPPIEGVTACPVLRPDGTVCDTPGYDPQTRLFYHPDSSLRIPPVPDEPTPDDLVSALDTVNDVIGEFPFEDGASHSNTVALMLTSVVRPCIEGPVPMALLDAPQAGTGKSLLADVISHIATGRYAAMFAAPVREEEWTKKLTSVILGGATVVTIDNIDRPLESAALASAITSGAISDRILGQSKQVDLKVSVTWMGTGNNIQLGRDMPRRCYWIRLDAQTSRPWEAREFRHSDLRGYVQKERGRLLSALLTIARSWYVNGQPAPPKSCKLGGFEEWSRVIGGMMENLGDPSFLKNADTLYQRSAEADNAWEGFLREWLGSIGSYPVTVRELAHRLDPEHMEYSEDLHDLVPSEVLNRNGDLNRSKFGKALARQDGVRYGQDNLRLERDEADGHTQKNTWKVVTD
ncbi:MAG: hypothetical protein GF320_08485 [Armatimonadia bacterium]|nr:hypothetical protein [Armatimonadia bacterium]